MQLTCKTCGLTFKSLILVPEQALQEIVNQFAEHFGKSHIAENKIFLTTIARINAYALFLVLINTNTTFPDLLAKEIEKESISPDRENPYIIPKWIDFIDERLGIHAKEIGDLLGIADTEDSENEDEEESEGEIDNEIESDDEPEVVEVVTLNKSVKELSV